MLVQLNVRQEADNTHGTRRGMFQTDGADKRGEVWPKCTLAKASLQQQHWAQPGCGLTWPELQLRCCVDSCCSRAAVRCLQCGGGAVYAPVCSGGAAYPLPRPACTGHCTRLPPQCSSTLSPHPCTVEKGCKCASHGTHCRCTHCKGTHCKSTHCGTSMRTKWGTHRGAECNVYLTWYTLYHLSFILHAFHSTNGIGLNCL